MQRSTAATRHSKKGRGRVRSQAPVSKDSARNADSPQNASTQKRDDLFELELLNGLAPVAAQELTGRIGARGRLLQSEDPDRIACEYSGDLDALKEIRTAVAVFKLLYSKVPRPLGVVQGANLQRLLQAISALCAQDTFRSFRIGAAGSDSAVFQKIKRAIEEGAGLRNDENDGEMSIRFRRSKMKRFGWDVLLRITPRPLSARAWREQNMPGALNATIAAAMVQLMDPQPEDRFLNLMCGSGTLLAERAAICPTASLVGVDISDAAIQKARQNLSSVPSVTLLRQDAGTISLADNSFNALCADLPWGRLIGERENLEECYRRALGEMTRVCEAAGKLSVLTQETELFEQALRQFAPHWRVVKTLRVKQSEYRPKLYLLSRTKAPYAAQPS